jgi:hypothetical protein
MHLLPSAERGRALPQRGKAYPLDAGGTLSCTFYSFMHRKV